MEKGKLFLVSVPIGNIEDITLRALKVLNEVDVIAAEDTRVTLKLLNYYEIKKPLISYYEHNKDKRGKTIIEKLKNGENVALVSDAGTPGISDPGEDLVKYAIDSGIDVTMIPGPCAAIMGLVLSGMPTGRFVFEGFLPINKRSRKERLNALRNEERSIVLYEAPHKLIYTLNDLLTTFGDRKITIARELTKKYEEITRCSIEEAIAKYSIHPPLGEFVLIVEGESEDKDKNEYDSFANTISIKEHVEMYLNSGKDLKEAMKKVAKDRKISKSTVYKEYLKTSKSVENNK